MPYLQNVCIRCFDNYFQRSVLIIYFSNADHWFYRSIQIPIQSSPPLIDYFTYSDSEKVPRLREGRDHSDNPEDYEFGLSSDEIAEYTRMSDLLYASFVCRFSPTNLTSYFIKLIDYVPAYLREGNIKSLMR